MIKKKTFTIKIIIVGDPAVGKTSLVKKFISGQFIYDYRASIGINMFTKEMDIDAGLKIKIQIWDIILIIHWIFFALFCCVYSVGKYTDILSLFKLV